METTQRRFVVAMCLLALLPACSGNDSPPGETRPCESASPCDCCDGAEVCFEGQCCVPGCADKSCGSDGCGGSCGSCTEANDACNEQSGRCECAREDDKTFCEAHGKPCGSATGKDHCGRDATVSCSFCGVHERCDLASESCQCVAESDAELCQAAGRSCGKLEVTDRCGVARALACGTCEAGLVCDAASSTCIVCAPDDVAAFCLGHAAACGPYSGLDNCGENRQVDCGGCDPGSLCTLATNSCDPCTSETDAEYCARTGTPPLDCGALRGTDNCNVARTFQCGGCAEPRFCDPTHHCHDCVPEADALFCAAALKHCGPATGVDTCGNERTVQDCGQCSAVERCEAGTCVPCVQEPDDSLCAFYFKACGTPTLVDHCGITRTPNCGAITGCPTGLSCVDGVCNDGVSRIHDTCASPQRLVFDATGTATASDSLTGAFSNYSGSCGGSGGDLVYAFTLEEAKNVEVTVTDPGATVQPTVYLRGNCTIWLDLACGSATGPGGSASFSARALAAGTYFLIVDSASTGGGSFDLTVNLTPPPPPPTNDTCATAQTLLLVNGVASVQGDTSSAADDYDDLCIWSTLDGPEVVFKVTVPAPTALVATVTGDPRTPNFHPVVQLLATCPSGGNALSCGPQVAGIATAAASNLAAGDYYVVVDGTLGSRGLFSLEVKLLAPATNDLCSGAEAIPLAPVAGSSELRGSAQGDTSIASDDDTSSCNSGGTGRDLVYSFTLPAGSDYSVEIQAAPTSGSAFLPTLFVKTGCGPTDIEKDCVSQSSSGPATLHFNRLRPGTYLVFVDGYSIFSNGAFTLSISASTPPPAPTNDTCASPTVVALDRMTGAAQITASTVNAADDLLGDCTNSYDMQNGPELVYAVTMPLAGGLMARVTPDTATSPNYQPAVYIQATCGDNSTSQACSNYNWSGFAAATANGLTQGSTYYVVVDGRNATAGSFTLELVAFGPLTNDGCASATTMTFDGNGDFVDRGDLCSATGDTMDVPGQSCGFSSGYGPDVVYKLVTTQAKSLSVSYRSGQNWTSQLYLRTSCGNPASQILCSEVPNGGVNTLVARNLPAGEYYLWLDNGYFSDCGIYTISAHLFDPPSPPSNDQCAAARAIPISQVTGTGAVSGTTDSAIDDATGTCATSRGGDVVYSFSLNTTRTVRIAVTPQTGSDLQPVIFVRTDCSAQGWTELGCTAAGAPNATAQLDFPRLSPAVYFLVVDSSTLNATGAFDVTISTATPLPTAINDQCSFATQMPAFDPATHTAALIGDTLAANNDDSSGCATTSHPLSGPDLVYSFELAAPARVIATVTRDVSSPAFKPALAIRRSCAAPTEVACATDWPSGSTGTATLATNLAQGTWDVFIDGVDGSFGGFLLEVAVVPGATVVAGDTCGSAIPLVFNGATATASGDLLTASLHDDYVGASCAASYSSPDMVYSLALSSDSFLTITMAAGASGSAVLEPGSYLRRVCDDPSSEVACAATFTDGGGVTYTTPRLPAGTYYLFADSASSWSTGSFDLTVTINAATGTAPANDRCAGAIPIAFDPTSGTAQVTGDTNGAFDDYSGSGGCGPFAGPLSGGDLVYSLTVPQGATVAAVVSRGAGSSYIPAVYLRDSCASPYAVDQLACSTSATDSTGFLLTGIAAAGTYYLVVDGQAGTGGPFTLDLFLQTSPLGNTSCATAEPLAFITSASTGAAVARAVGDTMLGSGGTEGIGQGTEYCFSTGNELYYEFTTSEVQDLTIDVTPLSTSYAPAVYVRSNCGDAYSQLACSSTSSGPITLHRPRLPQGSYTIVVDSQYSSGNGPFSMQVTLVDPPPPPTWDVCGAARALSLPASGSAALVISDSSAAANDDYTGRCATASDPMDGGDLAYSFSVTAATQVTATVTPRANSPIYRAAVYIRSICGTISDDVCAFSSGMGPTSPVTVKASLPIGDYYLIVDGVSGSSGEFDLELSQDTALYLGGDHCIDVNTLDNSFVPGTLPSETVASFSGTTTLAVNDSDGSCLSGTGPEIVYGFTVVRTSVVRIDLSAPAGSGYSPHFYVRTSCADPSSEIFCKAPSYTTTPASALLLDVPPGTYFLFVDTWSQSTGGGDFAGRVSVRDPPPPPANDQCRGATALGFVTGSTATQQVATLLGEDSTFANGDSTGGCFAAQGADLVYQLTLGAAQSFAATVTPDSSSPWLRPALYLRTACLSSASSAEVTCGWANAPGAAATIRSNRLPQGTYYLVVDAAPGLRDPPGGRFDLTVTLEVAGANVPANDGCSGAQQIALSGQAPSVTTLAGQTTAGATDDSSGSCSQTGPDVVYYFDLTAAARVQAGVTAAPGFSPAVYLRTSCGTSQVTCAASASTTLAEATADYLASGRYYLWVDAGSAGSSGSFDLTLTLAVPAVPAPPANDLCNGTLPALTQGVAVTGTTEGAFDNYAGACGMGTPGPDVVYAYTPTANGPFAVTLVANGADLAIWMTEGLCGDPNSCLKYDDTHGGYGGVDSFIWSAGKAGVTYYLVVDSNTATNAGSFGLTVN